MSCGYDKYVNWVAYLPGQKKLAFIFRKLLIYYFNEHSILINAVCLHKNSIMIRYYGYFKGVSKS